MAQNDPLDVGAFALAYQQLADAVTRAAPRQPAPFAQLLQEHLGMDTTTLAVVAMPVEVFDQPNLQRALDALGAEDGVDVVRVVGMRGEHRNYGAVSLATLTQANLNLEVGPVDPVERPVDTNRTLTCIDFGLLLLRVGSTPFAPPCPGSRRTARILGYHGGGDGP